VSATRAPLEGPSTRSPGSLATDDLQAIPEVPPAPSAGRPQERVGLGEALRRYPLVVILAVVVFAVAGGAAGLRRSPTYTAVAQVVVDEPTTPNAAQLPGVVQASQDYSASAARLITATPIVRPLARRFHTTVEAVTGELSATPIPQSSLIKVVAESRLSRDHAVALANSAVGLFTAYATRQAQDPVAVGAALHEFQVASARYRAALAAQKRLQASKSPSSVALVYAAAASEAAQLRQQTLAAQYRTAVEANSNAPRVNLLLPARGAGSNRKSSVEIFLFAGIVAGLVIGAALALWIANRRRSPTVPI
jgi:hypothetical protein